MRVCCSPVSLREQISVPSLSSEEEKREYLNDVFHRRAAFPFGVAGMGVGFSNAELVTAAMEQKMMGTIAATGIGFNSDRAAILAETSFERRAALYRQANARVLLQQIRAVRERMPFGILAVNVLAAASDFEDIIDVMGRSGEVDMAFVGAGLPRGLAKQMEQFPRMRYLPIVSSDRAAKIMLKSSDGTSRPPDGFYVEDPTKAGGHLGAKDVADAEDAKKFDPRLLHDQIRKVIPAETPLVAGGGLGYARKIQEALTMGYDGALAGTRFLLTRESGLPDRIIRDMYLSPNHPVATVMTSPAGLPSRIIQGPKNPDDYRWEIRAQCVACIGSRCGFIRADKVEEGKKSLDERIYCLLRRLPKTQRGEDGGVLFTGSLDELRTDSLYVRSGQPHVPTVKQAMDFVFGGEARV